jgi:phosphoglycolate phosphatase-like HAD superfamily hydrolase
MIGSSAFDLAGAKNISIRTVFLDTIEQVYPAQMYEHGEPDIIGRNLVECVTKMIEFERVKKLI